MSKEQFKQAIGKLNTPEYQVEAKPADIAEKANKT